MRDLTEREIFAVGGGATIIEESIFAVEEKGFKASFGGMSMGGGQEAALRFVRARNAFLAANPNTTTSDFGSPWLP